MIMKSLQESLFDDDLVSKDTGLEYLYDIITHVYISISGYRMNKNFLKRDLIKKEYLDAIKKRPLKNWTGNRYIRTDRISNNPNEEILRKLLYVIACNVKTINFFVKKNGKLDIPKAGEVIGSFVEKYINTDEITAVVTFSRLDNDRFYLTFLTNEDKELAVGEIDICFDLTVLDVLG